MKHGLAQFFRTGLPARLPVDGAFITAQLAGNEVVYSVVLAKAGTRLVVKILKVISRASFQRSSTIHFGTLSAELPFQPAPPPIIFLAIERHVYDRLAVKRWFYANNREFKQYIQEKIHAETRFRFPSFSRFCRCREKSCGISKIAEDLLSR